MVPHGAIVVNATQGNSAIVRGPASWSIYTVSFGTSEYVRRHQNYGVNKTRFPIEKAGNSKKIVGIRRVNARIQEVSFSTPRTLSPNVRILISQCQNSLVDMLEIFHVDF